MALSQTIDKTSPGHESVDVAKMREDIYLGKGYHVIRGFLGPGQVDHITNFWNGHNNKVVRHYSKATRLFVNCPNYTVRSASRLRHFNFFWNKPADMFTHVTAWRLQSLRNLVEGNPPNKDFLPHWDRNPADKNSFCVSSYRLVFTQKDQAVPPHIDWALDHSRVQLSLQLSNHGEDFNGGLVVFDKFRGGSPRNVSEVEKLRAGDLVVFRYSQNHAVEAISTDHGRGFLRMLMPHELIPQHSWFRRFVRRLKKGKQKGDYDGGTGGDETPYYNEDVGKLMKLAVREGHEPSDVFYYRGLWGRWDPMQSWQLKMLEREGLKPQHSFLDIGCGPLRLGMKLIPFLDDDKYCGVDPVEGYIRLGHTYMREVVPTTKKYTLSVDDQFNFGVFNRKFDFAMSASVFTHMSYPLIEQCLRALAKVMNPGGRLIFTIVMGHDKEKPLVYAGNVPMVHSQHKDLSFYENLGRELGFKLRKLDVQDHPSEQTACEARF